MRFVCLTPGYHPDQVGGAWRVAAAVAEGLAGRGHQVEVVTGHPGGSLPDTETRAGVRIRRFPNAQGNFLANWLRENRAAGRLLHAALAAGGGPAVVLQHHAYLAPALRRRDGAVLHFFHGPWAEEFRFARRAQARGAAQRCLDRLVAQVMRRVEGRALRRAGCIVVLSRYIARQIPRWHGAGLGRLEVVPGGVDPVTFVPAADRAGLRASLDLRPVDFLFLAARRLDPRMGLEVLITAFASIAQPFPRAQLWLTGRGPHEEQLRKLVDRLGVARQVRFLGFVSESEMPRLLSAADCTVMPSLDLEGFGLATVESLACGTPVLGSSASANPEVLGPLDEDLLFPAGSTDALAAKLAEVLRNPGRLPVRERCVEYARQRFSWDRMVQASERLGAELTAAQ